jgi:hypothetical protein
MRASNVPLSIHIRDTAEPSLVCPSREDILDTAALVTPYSRLMRSLRIYNNQALVRAALDAFLPDSSASNSLTKLSEKEQIHVTSSLRHHYKFKIRRFVDRLDGLSPVEYIILDEMLVHFGRYTGKV